MSQNIIAISSNKGGVAKTITTVNLGAALALQDYRVLLVDLDQQANATQNLDRYGSSTQSIADVLCGDTPAREAIIETEWHNLFLLPSHKSFSNAAIILRSDEFGIPQDRLRVALDTLEDDYDIILIDCPPSLDIVTANAYRASQHVIVPITPSEFALEGLGAVFESVQRAGRGMGKRAPRILGALATRVTSRLKIVQHNMDQLRLMGIHTFHNTIQASVKVIESETQKQPLIHYATTCTAARDYISFASEVASLLIIQDKTRHIV